MSGCGHLQETAGVISALGMECQPSGPMNRLTDAICIIGGGFHSRRTCPDFCEHFPPLDDMISPQLTKILKQIIIHPVCFALKLSKNAVSIL